MRFNKTSQWVNDRFLSSRHFRSRMIMIHRIWFIIFFSEDVKKNVCFENSFQIHTKSCLHVSRWFCHADFERIFFFINFSVLRRLCSLRIQRNERFMKTDLIILDSMKIRFSLINVSRIQEFCDFLQSLFFHKCNNNWKNIENLSFFC